MGFNPATDIADLGGKVIFITGGTAGLGRQSILAFAKKNPKHIFFSGRDADRAASLISEVTATTPSAQLSFVECNMSSLASVSEAAKKVASQTERLDILMCNAGVFTAPPALTEDGYETQFGINHLAHALLLKLLRPTLLRTPDARVVVLSSLGFTSAPSGGILFDKLRTTQSGFIEKQLRYPQTKLANIIYAAEMARRYPQLTAVSVHPGVAATGMLLDAPWSTKVMIKAFAILNSERLVSPETGAFNQLWAATVDKSSLVNGEFYMPVGVLGKHTKWSSDKQLAAKLWEWTEKELEGYKLADAEQGS